MIFVQGYKKRNISQSVSQQQQQQQRNTWALFAWLWNVTACKKHKVVKVINYCVWQ